jgi:hypothetical protein
MAAEGKGGPGFVVAKEAEDTSPSEVDGGGGMELILTGGADNDGESVVTELPGAAGTTGGESDSAEDGSEATEGVRGESAGAGQREGSAESSDEESEEEEEEEEGSREGPVLRRHSGRVSSGGGSWGGLSSPRQIILHLSPRGGSDSDDEAEIRVGESFQASVPPISEVKSAAAEAPPPPPDAARVGTVVWDPEKIPYAEAGAYLKQSAAVRHPTEFTADAALNHLAAHSYDRAAAVGALSGAEMPDTSSLDAWSDEDIRKFEEGIVKFGKDFSKIYELIERKYPVSMLVLYYFSRWKKTPNYKIWQSRWKDFNSDECHVCGKGGVLLCCDGCPAAYHTECAQPTWSDMDSVPDGPWYCPSCELRRQWIWRVKKTSTTSYTHTPGGALGIGAPFSPLRPVWAQEAPTPASVSSDQGPLHDLSNVEFPAAPTASPNDDSSDRSPSPPQSGVGVGAIRGRGRGGRTGSGRGGRGRGSRSGSSGGASSRAGRGRRSGGGGGSGAGRGGSSRRPSSTVAGAQAGGGVGANKRPRPRPSGVAAAAARGAPRGKRVKASARAAQAGAGLGRGSSIQEAGTPDPAEKAREAEPEFVPGEVLAVQGDPDEDPTAPFWLCAVFAFDGNVLEAAWYEAIGGKPMAPGVRMKQLNWRDKVSKEAVYCWVRGGREKSTGSSDGGPTAAAPQTLKITQQEWDRAMECKRESELAAKRGAAQAMR